MHLMVKRLGLVEAINRRLPLFKVHLPYHESDHVLNIAYNLLAGGTCLEHLELRRNDEAYLDAQLDRLEEAGATDFVAQVQLVDPGAAERTFEYLAARAAR